MRSADGFLLFLKHCKSLGFDQEPDYKYLRALLNWIATENHLSPRVSYLVILLFLNSEIQSGQLSPAQSKLNSRDWDTADTLNRYSTSKEVYVFLDCFFLGNEMLAALEDGLHRNFVEATKELPNQTCTSSEFRFNAGIRAKTTVVEKDAVEVSSSVMDLRSVECLPSQPYIPSGNDLALPIGK